jgi:hypothetical protein
MNISKTKKVYIAPELIRIELDKEISLAMESDPNPYGEPGGPEWSQSQNGIAPDPFKTQLG